MKYMGIDFGEKKIGLSLSDDGGQLAFPKEILKNSPNVLSLLLAIAKENAVLAFVIGESESSSGKPNPIMKEIEAFAKKLKNESGKEVFFEKEAFTTLFARNPTRGKEIFTARKTKEIKEGPKDASAAALILQRFLDRKNM